MKAKRINEVQNFNRGGVKKTLKLGKHRSIVDLAKWAVDQIEEYGIHVHAKFKTENTGDFLEISFYDNKLIPYSVTFRESDGWSFWSKRSVIRNMEFDELLFNIIESKHDINEIKEEINKKHEEIKYLQKSLDFLADVG